jgi:hypothetical protein
MSTADRGVVRKVLSREDFGLCVCWPKTLWGVVPGPGGVTEVLVDGEPARVRVETEPCNCQGNGWHEHRFLKLLEPGVAAGQRVEVAVPDAGAPLDAMLDPNAGLALSQAVDETNDAALLGKPLSATRRKTLAMFIAKRQGLPGSYGGLFAPVGDEIAGGYVVFTGERMRAGAGADHILGEEALRALLLLERQAPPARSRTLASEALRRATEAMEERLSTHPFPALYCCMRCGVALWRVFALDGYPHSEERLARGLEWLSGRRDGKGGWTGMPYYYTLSALVEAVDTLPAAVAELSYAREAIEHRLARAAREAEPYATRRRVLLERALDV